MNNKVQHMLDTVDDTVAVSRDKSFIKRSYFALKHTHSVSIVAGGSFLLSFTAILNQLPYADLSIWMSALISLPAGMLVTRVLFGVGKYYDQKLQDHHLIARPHLDFDGFVLLDQQAFASSSSTLKINVLKIAQQLNLDNELFKQLVAVSSRTDIPKGWWRVLYDVLNEQLVASQDQQMSVVIERQSEEELKDFQLLIEDNEIVSPQHMKVQS